MVSVGSEGFDALAQHYFWLCACTVYVVLVPSYFMEIAIFFNSRNDDLICYICIGTTVVWGTIGVFVSVDSIPRQQGAEEKLSVSLRNAEFCLLFFSRQLWWIDDWWVFFWVLRPFNLCFNCYFELLLLGSRLRMIEILSENCHFPFLLLEHRSELWLVKLQDYWMSSSKLGCLLKMKGMIPIA